jgi:hypothetical protein
MNEESYDPIHWHAHDHYVLSFPTLPEVVRLKCIMYIFKSCAVKRTVLLQLLKCKNG